MKLLYMEHVCLCLAISALSSACCRKMSGNGTDFFISPWELNTHKQLIPFHAYDFQCQTCMHLCVCSCALRENWIRAWQLTANLAESAQQRKPYRHEASLSISPVVGSSNVFNRWSWPCRCLYKMIYFLFSFLGSSQANTQACTLTRSQMNKTQKGGKGKKITHCE